MMSLEEARTKFPLKSTVWINRNVTHAEVTAYSTTPDVTGAPLVLLHVRYRDDWGRMKSYKVHAGLCTKADA